MLVINSDFTIINYDFITLKMNKINSTVLQSYAITFHQFLQPFAFSYSLQLVPIVLNKL